MQNDTRVAAQLLESIIFIIDSVLPLLRKLPPSVVEELEQDLKQMIVRRSFLTVVHACIKYFSQSCCYMTPQKYWCFYLIYYDSLNGT